MFCTEQGRFYSIDQFFECLLWMKRHDDTEEEKPTHLIHTLLTVAYMHHCITFAFILFIYYKKKPN